MKLLSGKTTPLMDAEFPRQQNHGSMTLVELLKNMFGYEKFRPVQAEAIDEILSGKDTVDVIPTGGGKTVIYTIPSILRKGISIVISPIVMLTYDQVSRLREIGANACYYNTLLSQEERYFTLHNLARADCQYEFAFKSPEAVLSPEFMSCLEKLKVNKMLQNLIVDEAHCIETWGDELRKDYRQLGNLRKFEVPFVALTGTATNVTLSIVTTSLKMEDYSLIKLPCRRDNLIFEVVTKEDPDPQVQLVNLIIERFAGVNGIVYCHT